MNNNNPNYNNFDNDDFDRPINKKRHNHRNSWDNNTHNSNFYNQPTPYDEAPIKRHNNNDFDDNGFPSNKVTESNDLPIMSEIMNQNEKFCSILSTRVNGWKSLSDLYSAGNYEDALSQVVYCKDLGLAHDFFTKAILEKEWANVQIKSDQAIHIFPVILKLCTSGYDVYFKTGVNTAWVILKLFYDVIIQVKTTPWSRGIDLNREDRIQKYEIIIDYFEKWREWKQVDKMWNKGKIEGLNWGQFVAEVDYFIKTCMKGNS